MRANYRFDSKKHDEGEKNKNKIGASKCGVKDVRILFGAENASRRTRVNCNNRQTTYKSQCSSSNTSISRPW